MAKEIKNLSPIKLELLITIVPKEKEIFYLDYLEVRGSSNLQLSTLAHGTAKQEVLEYLGLDNNDKSVIFSVVREDRLQRILAGLEDKFSTIRNGKGIAVAVPFTSVIGKLVFGFLSGDADVVKGENQ